MISTWAGTVGLSARTIAPYSLSGPHLPKCSPPYPEDGQTRGPETLPRTIATAIYNIFSMEKLKVKVVDTTSEPTKTESKERVQGAYLLFLFCVPIPHLVVNEREWSRSCNKHPNHRIPWTKVGKKSKYQSCLLGGPNFFLFSVMAPRDLVKFWYVSSPTQAPYFSE